MKDTWNSTSKEGKIKKLAALKKGLETLTKNRAIRLLETPTELLGVSSRKKKVFNEQGKCCNRCKIVDCNNEQVTFELEHKDGNRNNNFRENLEVLCPNCHSQTTTWRGRNNKRYSTDA